MSAYKTDPNHSVSIVNLYNQAVVISLDVKHHPIIGQKGGAGVIPLYVVWAFPSSIFCFPVPCFELLFTVGVLDPEVPKCLLSYNSQSEILTKVGKVPIMGNV